MASTRSVRPQTVSTELPPVPLTIEGYSVLHQMMRFRWPAWRPLRAGVKTEIIHEASSASGQDGAECERSVGALFPAGTQGRSDVRALPAIV